MKKPLVFNDEPASAYIEAAVVMYSEALKHISYSDGLLVVAVRDNMKEIQKWMTEYEMEYEKSQLTEDHMEEARPKTG